MRIPRKLTIVLMAGLFAVVAAEAANELLNTQFFSLTSPAEARVGRPLTPVSVAGVARRTTRRCAAGVYNC
jgi:predicted lysophospholipase L1 biosynthesis ABC-type transport system permease subunit